MTSSTRQAMLTGCFLAAALITACDSGGSDSRPDQPSGSATPGSALIAFHQADRMRFADATGKVWGEIETASPQSAVWSADGKHFAWLDSSRLHIVEAATGNDRPQPCPCAGLDRLGDVFATISADGSALLLFEPSGAPRRVPLRRPMPGAAVTAGGRDQVAVVEPIPEDKAAYRGQHVLVAIDREANTRLMIEGDSAVSPGGGYTSPDGSRIAIIEAPSGGACWTTPGIFSLHHSGLNPKAERMVPADTPFTEAVLGEARFITAVSWAGDGLVVTFGPNSCQRQYPFRYISYYLNGTEWQFLRTGLLGAAFGADGRSYGIELAGSITMSKDQVVRGKLVLTLGDGARKELADDVSSFWPTPAEQVAGRPQPSSPPTTAITTTDRGVPLIPKFQDLAKQIADALAKNDIPALEVLCAACDKGTRELIRTQTGREDLRRVLRTHPGGDERSVTFPGLALNRCVDAPDSTLGCTLEQLRDIGTLGLPSTLEISDPGASYTAPIKTSLRFVLDNTGEARWAGKSTSARDYLNKGDDPATPESYFFTSPDGEYTCGFNNEMAACQGRTAPIPPRPASCAEGPGWGYGMFVNSNKEVDFLCAGGVIFYPVGREPQDRDKLATGQTISAMGFSCSAEESGIRCIHDASGRGFRIAPTSNERF